MRKRNEVKIPKEIRAGLKPPEKKTVAQWAEENLILSELTCPEPGPFRISRTPYVRGPLEAFNSPWIEWIVLVWGRQTGKTQGIEFSCLCYTIDQDPGPALFVFPSKDLAEYSSTYRIQPLIESCKILREKKSSIKDEFTTLEMKFKSMVLSLVGAGSGSQLMTRPIRYLFRDEVDEFKKGVGQDAGDPLKISQETTSNFSGRKIIDASTTTTPEGNIWSELKRCQFVFEYWIPCPHCGAKQILYWENVKFGEDKDPEVVSSVAYYECEACQGKIRNIDKVKALEKGEWRARLTKEAADQILKNVRARYSETNSLEEVLRDPMVSKIGFHLPKWYSPFPNGTFGHAAKEFLEAQNDFLKLKDWKKFWAARPWEETYETKDEKEVLANTVDLEPLICPRDTIALTCEVDPSSGGFYFTVVAWKWDLTPHLVHYGFLVGWDAVKSLIWENHYRIDGQEESLGIWRTGIDTGGGQYEAESSTMTEEAYDFLRKFGRGRAFATKGMSHPSGHRVKNINIDRMPGAKGEVIPGGLVLWLLDTDSFKDAIHFRLQVKAGDPGRLTFHKETGTDFVDQLLAEEKRKNRKTGQYEWVKIRDKNHYLDCLVGSFALADPEAAGGVKVLRSVRSQPKEDSDKEEARKSWIMEGTKSGSWIHR